MIEIDNEQVHLKDQFEIDHETKQFLPTGEDEIDKTLKYFPEIKKFYDIDRNNRPWVWSSQDDDLPINK